MNNLKGTESCIKTAIVDQCGFLRAAIQFILILFIFAYEDINSFFFFLL